MSGAITKNMPEAGISQLARFVFVYTNFRQAGFIENMEE